MSVLLGRIPVLSLSFKEELMGKLESKFQAALIKELRLMFPKCVILKNDSGYLQGVPDLAILWRNHWAVLECKKDEGAACQPNQRYYVKEWNEMSFASFIFPANKEAVLSELRRAFGVDR